MKFRVKALIPIQYIRTVSAPISVSASVHPYFEGFPYRTKNLSEVKAALVMSRDPIGSDPAGLLCTLDCW